MQSAQNNFSLSSPAMARLVADWVQYRHDVKGGASLDPNGPDGKLFAQFDKAFQPLCGEPSDTSAASDQQGTSASVPVAYSTDAIPAEVQRAPMDQFPPEDTARMQTVAEAAPRMATMARVNTPRQEVTDREDTVIDPRANDYGIRDHKGAGTNVSYSNPSDPVIRDHRHPEPVTVTTAPPAAPPPVESAPPPPQFGNTGTLFTSGADYDRLDGASANLQAAKQNALDHPDDPKAQQQFAEAAQALQLLANMLSQMSSMLASIADSAIKASKIQAA
jgi:hypothetical protein